MKNGHFIGRFTRRMTEEEISQFKGILDKAFNYAGFKYKKIFVEYPESKAEEHYYGSSSTTFIVEMPYGIQFKKGHDTVYGVKEIKFAVQPELGFSSDEKCQEVIKTVGLKGFGRDPFDMFEWSISIRTNGKYHEYRHHHRNDYIYEGKDHYLYYTEMEEFLPDIQFYLTKNFPQSAWN